MIRRADPLALCALFLSLLISASGQLQIAQAWRTPYGGPGGVDDAPTAIAVDANGDVAIVGSSVGADFTTNLYTAKYSGVDGSRLWEKRYAGDSRGMYVAFDSEGNVCVAGGVGTNLQAYVAKYAAANGAPLWAVTHPGLFGVDAMGVDPSGNVIVTGDKFANGVYNFQTVKLASSNGGLVWEKPTLITFSRGVFPSRVLCDPGGNVFVGGMVANSQTPSYRYPTGYKYAAADGAQIGTFTTSAGSTAAQSIRYEMDQVGAVYLAAVNYTFVGIPPNQRQTETLYVEKRGPDSALKWNYALSEEFIPQDAAVTPTGSFAVASGTGGIVKLQPDGTLHWRKSDSDFKIASVAMDTTGNVYLTGTKPSLDGTNRDAYTRKLAAADGSTIWEIRYNGASNKDEFSREVVVLPGGAAAITGTESDGSYSDIITIKYVPPPAFEVSTQAASAIGTNQATLRARVVPVGGATSVAFDYGTDAGSLMSSVTVASSVPEGIQPVMVSADITGLSKGVTYYFRARATNSGGDVMGEVVNFTTPLSALAAVDDVIFVPGRQVTFSPQDNDLDSDHPTSTLTVSILTQPVNAQGQSVGVVSAVPGTSALSFQANDSFVSSGTFRYAVQDPSGTTAEANVTLLRFGAVAGTYQGILSGAGGTGSLTVTVNGTAGSFSGSVLFAGVRYALDGRFDTRGTFLNALGSSGYAIQIEVGADGTLRATIKDSAQAVIAAGSLEQIDGGGTDFQPETGLYTTFLDIDSSAAAGARTVRGGIAPRPGGSGFLTVSIGKSKQRPARFVGMLPDSVKFSTGVPGLAGRRYALAQQLYKAGPKDYRGAIIGQPAFPIDSSNRLEAALGWSKRERPGDPLFPAGFGDLQLLLDAVRFVKTGKPIEFPQNISGGLPNMRLEFSGAGLSQALFATMRVDARNRAALIADGNNLQPGVKITPNPIFKGSFRPPGSAKPIRFDGGFRQGGIGGESSGQGTFVITGADGMNATGKVRMTVIE